MAKEYIDTLKELISNKDSVLLQESLSKLHPADIAEICSELDIEEARFLYRQLDNEKAADALTEMDEDLRKELLEELPSEAIAKRYVNYMDADDAVEIIRDMDEEQKEEVLAHITDIEQAGDIVDLLQYDKDTAGGLMSTEMVVVNENWSMPECLKEMRRQAEDLDDIYYIYVVDDDERLRGLFPLKKMVTSPSVSKVKHVMSTDVVSVDVDTPIEEIAPLIEKYNLVAIPVVDKINRLVGQITVDDVMDEVREQTEHDQRDAAGLTQDVESDDSVFFQTRARLPWLIIGMLGGIGSSMLLDCFSTTLGAHPEMALFIPLLAGMGGNVGVQSSAIAVQGLANNSLNPHHIFRHILKELAVALVNAAILSVIMYIYNMLVHGQADIVTFAVPLSLFVVVMFASAFGALIPLVLERMNINPAVATGPFIQIINDLSGMTFYMLISMLISQLFL
ncbi:MAG: magnesium transporter [Bacteroidaceae bacterium]|nr:magnesium transporter [Bacteroidales bacterium]MBQ2877684.1 magnesium transporter [Bacteroidaceae bacterium]MBQ3189532.1 magnesium transporter [Bacteroidaceae bacterium]MBQ3622211.1 magnesium transporter [Bacteroidaceae bacterium]